MPAIIGQNIKIELTKNPKDCEKPMEMLKSYKLMD